MKVHTNEETEEKGREERRAEEREREREREKYSHIHKFHIFSAKLGVRHCKIS
jgi:hypothetical protein